MNGLLVKKNSNSLVITGEFINNYTKSTAAAGNRPISNSITLIESNNKNNHIHIDDLTILNNDSDFNEIIIEKNDN